MNAPICEFVKEYCDKRAIRLHMPAHKGENQLGFEKFDITEIVGADSLFEADGIIKQSRENATKLFDSAATFYSTEGSSLVIRAMLALAIQGVDRPLILAGRNAHKSFVTAAALLDFDVDWLYGGDSLLSCQISAESLDEKLKSYTQKPCAVYITSPDYLGNIVDIKKIADVCHKNGVLLLVDNAHGAYLKFLPKSLHPLDLGADMCADSAHKTLPVLTGGAYLHVAKTAPKSFVENANDMLSLFASTSPSYLILQSLDLANLYLDENKQRFFECEKLVKTLKDRLIGLDFKLFGNEAFKITICPKYFGYSGIELANYLQNENIICEFFDEDFLVMMFSTCSQKSDFKKVEKAFANLPRRKQKTEKCLKLLPSKRAMSIRQAYFSNSELVETKFALHRVLSAPSVSCPPAVPIAICGEILDENKIKLFEYYKIEKIKVTKF